MAKFQLAVFAQYPAYPQSRSLEGPARPGTVAAVPGFENQVSLQLYFYLLYKSTKEGTYTFHLIVNGSMLIFYKAFPGYSLGGLANRKQT